MGAEKGLKAGASGVPPRFAAELRKPFFRLFDPCRPVLRPAALIPQKRPSGNRQPVPPGASSSGTAIQPFLQPGKHLFFILDRHRSAFLYRIMMAKLAVNIGVSVHRHGAGISWPNVNMKMRIGLRVFIKAVHQAAPVAQSRSQNRLQTGLHFTDQTAEIFPFILRQLRHGSAVTLQNQDASPDIILFIRKKNGPIRTLAQLKPLFFFGKTAPITILHFAHLHHPAVSSAGTPAKTGALQNADPAVIPGRCAHRRGDPSSAGGITDRRGPAGAVQ